MTIEVRVRPMSRLGPLAPATAFLAGAALLIVSGPLEWTRAPLGRPVPHLSTVIGFREDPLVILVLLLSIPALRLLFLRPWSAAARVTASAALVLAAFGQWASYIDINGTAVEIGSSPIFLAGYFVAMIGLGSLAVGTVLAFRTRES